MCIRDGREAQKVGQECEAATYSEGGRDWGRWRCMRDGGVGVRRREGVGRGGGMGMSITS